MKSKNLVINFFVPNIKVAQNILFPHRFSFLSPKSTPKGVPDGPDLPLIPITSHSRKGAEWLISQINTTSMQINVPWLIFMVTSSLFDFEYKQCVN